MADRDLRTDQSSEPGADDATGAGTGGGSGGSGGSDSTSGPERVAGDEHAPGGDTDPLDEGSPKDGPMVEADADDLEGIQQGTGGGGGGGWTPGGFLRETVEGAQDTVEDAIEDPADVPDDAYDAWRTLDNAPGEAYGDANSWAADRIWGDNSVADVYEHHERQVGEAWQDSGVPATYDDVEDAATKGIADTEDAVADGWTTSGARGVYDDVEESVAKGHDDTAEALDDGYDAWRTLDDAPGGAYGDANSWAADRIWGSNSMEDVYDHHERQVADAWDQVEDVATDPSDDLYGSGAPDEGDAGSDTGAEPTDPLEHLDDQNWNAARDVADQAAQEDVNEAAAAVEEVVDDPGPVDVPGPTVPTTGGLELG